ncbi:hypothetical protein RKD34_006245 [Streptomyces sp. SAI-218]
MGVRHQVGVLEAARGARPVVDPPDSARVARVVGGRDREGVQGGRPAGGHRHGGGVHGEFALVDGQGVRPRQDPADGEVTVRGAGRTPVLGGRVGESDGVRVRRVPARDAHARDAAPAARGDVAGDAERVRPGGGEGAREQRGGGRAAVREGDDVRALEAEALFLGLVLGIVQDLVEAAAVRALVAQQGAVEGTAGRLLVVGADDPQADAVRAPADVVVVHDPQLRVVLRAGLAVGLGEDVRGLDGGRRVRVRIGLVVEEQARPDAQDEAGRGDRGVGPVGPQVDVVLAAAGRVVVPERAVRDRDQDRGPGLLDGDGGGAETGLDVRVLAAVALVLRALVDERGQVAVGLADLEDEVRAGVDDVVRAVVGPAEARGGRGRGERPGERGRPCGGRGAEDEGSASDRSVHGGSGHVGVPPPGGVGVVRVLWRVTVESISRKGFRSPEVGNLVKSIQGLESACRWRYGPAPGVAP